MQPDAVVLFAVLAVPFLGAALALPAARVLGDRVTYFGAGVAGLTFLLLVTQHATRGAVAVPWVPSRGLALRLYVDGLALLIAYLAAGVGVLILAYSGAYMRGEPGVGRYVAALLGFLGSMLGLVLAGDLVALFVFWEGTSVTSFLLIGHYRREDAPRLAARKSMLVTVGGGLFVLVGLLLLSAASETAFGTATFDLARMVGSPEAMRTALEANGLLVPTIAFLGVGAAAKSAQVPLHIWLPDAMEAPTPVSAFLHSATMVTVGVYLVGRVRPILLSEPWTTALVPLGLATMTVTAVLAVGADDIKRLLAYSTASHLGLMIAGFGFGGFGIAAGLGGETGVYHVFNHATFKSTLFLVAGIVAHEVGTLNIDELSGVRAVLPATAGVATVASLAMAGIPPFNGFYSKELLFDAAYEFGAHEGGIGWLVPAVAVLGSVFTVLYSLRFLALFYGEPSHDVIGDPPLATLAPPALLALVVLATSLVPTLATRAIVDAAFAAVGGEGSVTTAIPTSVKPPVVMSAITVVGGIALFPVGDRLAAGVRRATDSPLRADGYYEGAVAGLERASDALVDVAVTGLLRTYATWTLAGFSTLALLAYAAIGVELGAPEITIAPAAILVLALAVVSAIAVTRAPSHITGVLTLSILGSMIAIFYVLSSAPDLALTQLVVESLVLVVFLLVLDRLPAFYGEIDWRRGTRDALLSVAVGATVFVTVLVATAADPTAPIDGYFLAQSVPQGGGTNVVNVILVDFRALDTLGEISVVAMAALAVVTLVGMRGRGETE
ncbi:Na+/H+ antiporter subunit A [Halobacteriales archaeon SW_7_68_16]|nr:MAG: Na+/H+ antiporter subunit A [Halobacteriales archaeon SW_7_68_16]